MQKVMLLSNVPSGLLHNEDGELIGVHPFIGKIGTVIEEDDIEYDAERLTGYESTYLLVDFGTQKLWIAVKTYFGDDENGKEIWRTYLKKVNDNSTTPV